jgi:uncharacterized membrane protein YphA (DoxX/SURF4 family)
VEKPTVVAVWVASLVISADLLWNAHYKLLGDPSAVWLFTVVTNWLHLNGAEQLMRIATGSLETLAAILILIPRARIYGAGLTIVVMSGAILTQLASPLGIDPAHDGARLFLQAVLLCILAITLLVILRDELTTLRVRLQSRRRPQPS